MFLLSIHPSFTSVLVSTKSSQSSLCDQSELWSLKDVGVYWQRNKKTHVGSSVFVACCILDTKSQYISD